MAFSVWVAASAGIPQLASIIPGLVGVGVGLLVAKTLLSARLPELRSKPIGRFRCAAKWPATRASFRNSCGSALRRSVSVRV